MKKQKVNSKDFIRIMREEYNRTLEKLAKIDDEKDSEKTEKDEPIEIDVSELSALLSPGLSIKHDDTGINYEITKVGAEKSIIQSPDGKKYLVSNDALDKNFSIN